MTEPKPQVIELLDQLREAATDSGELVLESLLGRIATIYVLDTSALAVLDDVARGLARRVSSEFVGQEIGEDEERHE